MISEERVEAAVEFIRDNADRLGELIGHCKGVEYQAKIIKAQAYLDSTGTIQARESEALCTPEYKSIVEDIEDAWAEKATLETKLRAAELTIDVWRSQYSKMGKGHL
jgi:hypothetical protein